MMQNAGSTIKACTNTQDDFTRKRRIANSITRIHPFPIIQAVLVSDRLQTVPNHESL
ncbi:hypothetical protein ANO14919_066390 [Xylariales sp. No.14919]|nr:hypothetical protein ANO14919_066390 [Xylariales sp. No.14919]